MKKIFYLFVLCTVQQSYADLDYLFQSFFPAERYASVHISDDEKQEHIQKYLHGLKEDQLYNALDLCLEELELKFVFQNIDRISNANNLNLLLKKCILISDRNTLSLKQKNALITLTIKHLDRLESVEQKQLFFQYIFNLKRADPEEKRKYIMTYLTFLRRLSLRHLPMALHTLIQEGKQDIMDQYVDTLIVSDKIKIYAQFIVQFIVKNHFEIAAAYIKNLSLDKLQTVLLNIITTEYDKKDQEKIYAFAGQYLDKLSFEHLRELLLECAIRNKESFARQYADILPRKQLEWLSQECDRKGLTALKDYISLILHDKPKIKR